MSQNRETETPCIAMTLAMPVLDYQALQQTAALVGLDLEDLCRLAIHRCTAQLSVDQWGFLSPLDVRLAEVRGRVSKDRVCAR